MPHETRDGLPHDPLHTAYALMGVDSLYALSRAYTEEDQKLMLAGKWDYENPDLITNQLRSLVEKIDPTTLLEKDKEWREEILWFWYHHAISCAIGRYKDKSKAQQFALEALAHQASDHPNKITRLLYFLVHDDLVSAERLAGEIEVDYEKDTAQELIEEYKTRGFF